MNGTITIAKDNLGGCKYRITITGTTLRCTMRGYGLEAFETQPVTRQGKRFNYDADALKEKMVTLERRMRELARLTTVLKGNGISGVARTSGPSVRRPARGVNPLNSIKV